MKTIHEASYIANRVYSPPMLLKVLGKAFKRSKIIFSLHMLLHLSKLGNCSYVHVIVWFVCSHCPVNFQRKNISHHCLVISQGSSSVQQPFWAISGSVTLSSNIFRPVYFISVSYFTSLYAVL